MRSLLSSVLIVSIAACMPDHPDHGDPTVPRAGGEDESAQALAATPAFQLPLPCGMNVDQLGAELLGRASQL